MSIVRIEQVSKCYQQESLFVDALSNIDLNIIQGEFTAPIGPSGSGKTTLLNLIGILDLPSAGMSCPICVCRSLVSSFRSTI